jgi:hypothetical protein
VLAGERRGAQHGQGPWSYGHRVAAGDRGGPLRVVGVQLDLPVRRVADVGRLKGDRLPPGVDGDELVVIQQRPLGSPCLRSVYRSAGLQLGRHTQRR